MPSISVIVPVYKVESFLRRCVDSILSQSFSDFELILVDDGSPDHCGAICDEYAAADNRVHVIHQKNGGLSAARNAGIDWAFANSDSRWLAFVDSDDWVHPDYLARLFTAVRETDSLLSVCGYRRTGGEPLPEPEAAPAHCLSADEFICENNGSTCSNAVAWNKLYHKSLFRELRYPVGKLNEDEFTTYRLVYLARNVAVTDAVLYAYYQNPDGIMLSKWNPRRLHILEAFEQQIAFASEQNNERLLKKSICSYLLAIHEQLHAADASYGKALRSKYRKALKLCRTYGVLPPDGTILWAYEEAYPCKLFWWPFFRGRQLLERLFGKDKAQ